MAQKKSSRSTAKKADGKSAAAKQRRHITSVVLLASAALLMCMAIITGEHVWTYLHRFIMGTFGWNAYLIPLLLGYIGVLFATDRDSNIIIGQALIIAGLLIMIAGIADIYTFKDETQNYWKHLGSAYMTARTGKFSGGFTGALLGGALYCLFGKTAAKVTAIVLLVAFIMLFTGTTVVSLLKAVQKPAKRIKEAAEDAYERNVERRAEREAERAQTDIDLSVPADRSQYDVPVDGEEVRPKKKKDLRQLRKKVIEEHNGESKIDIDIDAPESKPVKKSPFDIELNSDEGTPSSDNAERDEPVLSPELLDALAGEVDVVSDPTPKQPLPDDDIVDTVGEVESIEKLQDTEEEEYRFPPIDLLDIPKEENTTDIRSELTVNAEKLVDTLHSFGVDARVINISRGPSITRYELQPAAGVRISKIANLTDDLALSLATSGVRIEAPIPNKPAVGIEVPNKAKSNVAIRSLIECDAFNKAKSRITGVLGKDITGENCYMDIAKMPHILIAGTTGSGKSVCLNSLIMSILYKASPDEVKLVMIDPKAVEMKVYNGIPHLLVPVVTDPRKASGTLGWAVTEMLRRYQLLSEYDVRNIDGYNELAEKDGDMQKLPQIVIFIDELADLMMAAPSEVEDSICRLAQMARAAGMHLVIATQSPRADVITGLIKSNIPSRIALKVASNMESRIILDMQGAERLIGYGDMLYSPVGTTKPVRIQGCWVSDEEIKAVTDFIKGKGNSVSYDEGIMQEIERQAELANQKKKTSDDDGGDPDEKDGMFDQAVECVVEAGQASTSLLQRKLKLGYSRAARIMDQLEQNGIIGPFEGSKPRAVLISKAQLMEMRANQ